MSTHDEMFERLVKAHEALDEADEALRLARAAVDRTLRAQLKAADAREDVIDEACRTPNSPAIARYQEWRRERASQP